MSAKAVCFCECMNGNRVGDLESLVRRMRDAIRAAEPDPDEGIDAVRSFIRATDGAVVASLKLVPE